jgi:hypothetical protein
MNGHTPTSRAIELVLRWCNLYSRNLPDEVAAARREELLGDLTDQVEWETQHGVPQKRVARSVLYRALRGAPADLSWRRSQTSLNGRGSLQFRRFGLGFLSVTIASGVVLMVLALTAILRTVQASGTVDVLFREPEILVVVSVMAMLLGESLLVRTRTRSLGALWMLLTAEVVVFVAIPMLANTGRLLSISSLSPSWADSLDLVGVGVALFYVTGALWWLESSSKVDRAS